MWLLLFAGLACVVAIPALAWKGVAGRGIYLAVALIACAVAFGCNSFINDPLPIGASVAEQRGAEFIGNNGPPFVIMLGMVCLGALIAAAIYRTKVPAMKICPHCAEHIQQAAVVCRFCGREQNRQK